jgi:hypothetical protein
MPSHQREQTAVFGTDRIDLPPAGQEVVVDETDYMKPIGDDHGLGEVSFDNRTVDHSQVHAHDSDLVFALQTEEIRLQGGFRAAQRDVIDAMVLQIAECRSVALLAGEEVLIDSQDLGAAGRMILMSSTLEAPEKVALHGSGSNALPPPQAASVDPIQVLLKDHLLEALTGALAGLHPRQPLTEPAAAIEAAALAHAQVQEASAESPIVMPDGPPAPTLVSHTRSPARGARYQPGIPGRYRNRAAASLDVVNLVLGQA